MLETYTIYIYILYYYLLLYVNCVAPIIASLFSFACMIHGYRQRKYPTHTQTYTYTHLNAGTVFSLNESLLSENSTGSSSSSVSRLCAPPGCTAAPVAASESIFIEFSISCIRSFVSKCATPLHPKKNLLCLLFVVGALRNDTGAALPD